MKYQLLSPPPVWKNLIYASKEEGKEFYKWFLDVKEERLKTLEGVVKSTEGYEKWEADFTPQSLDILGKWFKQVAEKRARTPEEIEIERSKLRPPFLDLKINDWTLSSKTVSLCFDIGVYFGEVFVRNFSELKWNLLQKNKFIGNNEPMIEGFGKVYFSPTHMMKIQAYKILEKRDDAANFTKLYNTWIKHIT
ncbi:MAG TPA: hypothetical protein VD999_02770 [Vitreimonas sp.]|nr:hypothetical protein [Vitreimonas sp.]